MGNGIDNCGAREYSIASTPYGSTQAALSALDLTIDPTSGVIRLYTANKATIGTHTATVTAKLANHDLVSPLTIDFQIVIEPCIVKTFKFNAASQTNKVYTVGDSASIW